MSDAVAPIPRRYEWLARFDLVRSVDGKLRLVLIDARTSLIESDQTDTANKMRHIAFLAAEGADNMRLDADDFEEPTHV